MRVTLNDTTYELDFEYKRDSYRDTTHCCIHKKVPDGMVQFIAAGTAFTSEADQFSKRVGRKVALKRALMKWLPNNKTARKVVWDQYQKQVRQPANPVRELLVALKPLVEYQSDGTEALADKMKNLVDVYRKYAPKYKL